MVVDEYEMEKIREYISKSDFENLSIFIKQLILRELSDSVKIANDITDFDISVKVNGREVKMGITMKIFNMGVMTNEFIANDEIAIDMEKGVGMIITWFENQTVLMAGVEQLTVTIIQLINRVFQHIIAISSATRFTIDKPRFLLFYIKELIA